MRGLAAVVVGGVGGGAAFALAFALLTLGLGLLGRLDGLQPFALLALEIVVRFAGDGVGLLLADRCRRLLARLGLRINPT
jgi:hypothetical protein